MRITPLDVRKQEFRRTVRGFDCDEVRAFMTTLADEYEIVLVDNKQLREKTVTQDEEIAKYQSMERTLRDTLMTAEKLMQETRENANKEGDLILQDAKLKGKEILQEYRHRAEELRRELDSLRKEKERYLGRFKSMAESQIQFIESHRTDFKELDNRMDGIVDSVIEGVRAGSTEPAVEAAPENAVESIIDTMIQPETASETIETPSAERAPMTGASGTSGASGEDIWRNYNPAETRQREAENAPEAAIENRNEAPAETPIANVDPFSGLQQNTPADPIESLQESIQDSIQEQPIAGPEQGPQENAPQAEGPQQPATPDVWQGAPSGEHPYFPAEDSGQDRRQDEKKDEDEEKESRKEDIYTETLNI